MRLKDQSKELERLIDSQSVVGNPSSVDDFPEELAPEPIFTLNYSKEMRDSIRKARRSINAILASIIPKDFIKDTYVQDKLTQDSESLGKLYYQLTLIEKVQQASVDSIGQGNVSPRMIEVFNQTSKSHADIVDQINKLQTLFRKNYIDLVLDIKTKIREEEDSGKLLNAPHAQKQIAASPEDDKYKRVFVGSRDLVNMLDNQKMEKFREATKDAEEVK